ncbi:hypothetical protein EFL77_08510 [Pediococcus pentosaceus]|uniref:hypothetical protein n=1 Tax=Pediococcus pentosaceus TaxID=1255 RepID=UPI00223A74AE|nr:hypothetical protein [Pediococcus pentosaceus]MCT1178537.1 hypothetical protein [Pediococcus pentosaceus]
MAEKKIIYNLHKSEKGYFGGRATSFQFSMILLGTVMSFLTFMLTVKVLNLIGAITLTVLIGGGILSIAFVHHPKYPYLDILQYYRLKKEFDNTFPYIYNKRITMKEHKEIAYLDSVPVEFNEDKNSIQQYQ